MSEESMLESLVKDDPGSSDWLLKEFSLIEQALRVIPKKTIS